MGRLFAGCATPGGIGTLRLGNACTAIPGEDNGSFNAYDATTGDKLWSFQDGAGVNSAPMAFGVDGKLHIAVAAGGSFQLNYKRGDAILVSALD